MSQFSRFPRAFAAVFLCLAVGLAFGETWGGGFFMDDHFVLRAIHEGGGASQVVRDLTGNWAGFSGYSYYRPLVTASLAADLATFGLDARGFHLANLLLHALNAILVLVLVRRTFPVVGWLGAFAVALLFAMNPVHPNAVGWIAARSDLLVCAFTLLVVLCYQRAWDTGRRRWLISGCLAFAAALAAKESAVVAIALAAIVPGRAGWRARLRGTAAGWGLLVVYFVWRLVVLDEGLGLHALGREVTLAERASMLWSRLAGQFALLAFPPELHGTAWRWVAIAVGGLMALGVCWRGGWRTVGFGAAIVILGLAPILPIIHNLDTRAFAGFSRYWYVPAIGAAMPAAFAVAWWGRWRWIPFAACLALAVGFALVSRERSIALLHPEAIATGLARAVSAASGPADDDTTNAINIVVLTPNDHYDGVLVNRLAFTSAAVRPFVERDVSLYPLDLTSAVEVIRRVGGHVPVRAFTIAPGGGPRVLLDVPRVERWRHETQDGPFKLTPGIALDIDGGDRSPFSFDLCRVNGVVGSGQIRASVEVLGRDGVHRVFRAVKSVSRRAATIDFDFREQDGFLHAAAVRTIRLEHIADPGPERHPTAVDEEILIDGVTVFDRPARATLAAPQSGETASIGDGAVRLRPAPDVPESLNVRWLTAFGLRPPPAKEPLTLADGVPADLWRELVVGANFGSGHVVVLPVPGEGRDSTRYRPHAFRLR